jgi:formate hydrogenlyase subunit 3/multisubunit Na+/H+ antiporter MnhD subunit
MLKDSYGILLITTAILFAASAAGYFLAERKQLAGRLNFLLITASALMIWSGCVTLLSGSVNPHAVRMDLTVFHLYFLIDGFSALFMAVICLIAVMASFYSIQYMEHYKDYSLRGFYTAFPLFIAGMLLLVTVDDLSLGFTFSWQLMTISSYFLIRFEHRVAENRQAANRYLVLMELAWLLIAGGAMLIEGAGAGTSLHELTAGLGKASPVTAAVILGLIFTGFAFKAGVFPFGQLWLPGAHSVAPSPVSALLSGVMLKTGIYGIMRTFFWMTPHGESSVSLSVWGWIIASFGAVTLFIGTVQSVKQSDGKRLLAYSSIGQLGYIVFAIGCALVMKESSDPAVRTLSLIAVMGALFHMMNHAVFKGLLFLTSGSVLYSTGIKDLNRLGGLMNIMPFTAVFAGIAALAISGVPPMSGFSSKWSIISTAILSGSQSAPLVIFGIVALFTSAVTLACYVKYFGMTFASSGIEWNSKGHEVKEVPVSMLAPKALLAVICIAQGLFPFAVFTLIHRVMEMSPGSIFSGDIASGAFGEAMQGGLAGVTVAPFYGLSSAALAPVIVLLVVAAALLLARFIRSNGGSTPRRSTTWMGGYQELGNLNRYSDKNMFSAFRNVMRWTGGNPRDK